MEEGADAVGVAGVVVMAELLSPKANLKLRTHKVLNRRVVRRYKAAIPKVDLADLPDSRTAASRIAVPVAAEGSFSAVSVRIVDPRIPAPPTRAFIPLPWITVIVRTCRTTTGTDVARPGATRSRTPRP
jgi:hypothetical protein